MLPFPHLLHHGLRRAHQPAALAHLGRDAGGGYRCRGGQEGLQPASALGHACRVARDQDSGHQGTRDPVRIAPDRPAVLLQPGALGAVGVDASGVAVPFVRVLGHDPEQAHLTVPADQDRRAGGLRRPGQQGCLPQRVIATVQGHRALGPESADHADALLEAVHPFAQRRQRDAERRVLLLVPAGAHPQHQPPSGEQVDRGRHPGQQGGMAEGHRADQGAEPDPAGSPGQRRQRGPGFQRGALGAGHDAEEVIGAPERVEAQFLDPVRHAEPALPGEPFLAFDHDPDSHTGDVTVKAGRNCPGACRNF